MSKGKEIYQHVCGESDQAVAIKELPEKDLREVITYADKKGKTGFAGTVFGLGALEVTRRFCSGELKGKGEA